VLPFLAIIVRHSVLGLNELPKAKDLQIAFNRSRSLPSFLPTQEPNTFVVSEQAGTQLLDLFPENLIDALSRKQLSAFFKSDWTLSTQDEKSHSSRLSPTGLRSRS